MQKRSTARNLLYILVSGFILLFFIEVVFSIFFYHKYGNEKLAIIEAGKLVKGLVKKQPSSINEANQKLVRPNASDEMNRQIAEEINRSNKFEYEPWVEFRNIDYTGQYVNVLHSVRKSDPNIFISTSSSDTLNIYFFGGSTTFGFNVADNETFPSQFVKSYKEKYPGGPSIRVFNYGTPTYYSYQELMLFTKLAFAGHKPGVVIFLDGVNDFWFAKASYYNQSYFSYILRQVFSQNLLTTGAFNFTDTADRMYKDPTDIPLKQYNDTLINHYFSNIRNAGMIANAIGAKAYFFCQPVPFYKYPNQQKDPICFKDQHTRYDYIYPIIESRASEMENFYFLGNMLTNEKGYPFVDGLHYSPSFTKILADSVINRIGEELMKMNKQK